MRLLRADKDGSFSLVMRIGNNIPPYAILSHTWGADGDEVTFKDLEDGKGKEKVGYNKLTFCANQAAQDGLEYFWVDTCCTIQTHHRRQCPTKRVAYAAENGGRTYLAFQYKRIDISLPESGTPYLVAEQPLSQHEPGFEIRQSARRDVRSQALSGTIFGPLSSVA